MLLKVDCLPNAVGKQTVHTLDLSWKKMDVKSMMMMMMNVFILIYFVHMIVNQVYLLVKLRMESNFEA